MQRAVEPRGADSSPAPTLAPSPAARNTEQQPGFQKSRRQEIRSHQVAGPLQTWQQLLLLRESAERDSSTEISAERGRLVAPGALPC